MKELLSDAVHAVVEQFSHFFKIEIYTSLVQTNVLYLL